MNLTDREFIRLIIENGSSGFYDHAEALLDYPVNLIIKCFDRLDKLFIRPDEWDFLSEIEQVIKLADWLKNAFGKCVDISVTPDRSFEYVLKYWVIRGMEHFEMYE